MKHILNRRLLDELAYPAITRMIISFITQLSYTASFHNATCFPLQYQKEEALSQQVLILHQEHLSCAGVRNLHL